jgi:Lipocalin-like domain
MERRMPPVVDANPLLGTWQLKAYLVTTAAGEQPTPYGENPTGYLSYCPDGRMQVIGVANGRIIPAGAARSDNERAALYG